MKKALFFIFLFAGFAAYSQTAQSTQVEFNKMKVPGVSYTTSGFDADFIQGALTYRLENVAKLKGSNSKGFRLYAAQIFPEFGNLKYDIYTLVDKGSKKDGFVTISILLSTGNENFVTPTDDPDLTQKMKDFLTDFIDNYLKEYERGQKIDALTTTINKLDKEINTLVSDRDKLKKDISNLENKLREKETALSNAEKEISKAKDDLETVKNNR